MLHHAPRCKLPRCLVAAAEMNRRRAHASGSAMARIPSAAADTEHDCAGIKLDRNLERQLHDPAVHPDKVCAAVHLISSRHMLERTLSTPGKRISRPIRNRDGAFWSRAATLITESESPLTA